MKGSPNLTREGDEPRLHRLRFPIVCFWVDSFDIALARRLLRYTVPHLLCIDEVGYLLRHT